MHFKMKTESSNNKEKLKSKLKALIVICFIISIYDKCGCLAINGDSSSMDNDQSTDMMENDPNLLIIPNKQGYGKDIPNLNDLPTDNNSGISMTHLF